MPRDATGPAPAAGRTKRRTGAPPPARDAERTRAAILAAAIDEFAAHGLGGARVDRIAARAKANKRMLYYYFGAKEALYLAALEAAYERIRGEEQQLDLAHLPPEQALRELVAFTWRYFLAHPEFMSLLNTENLYRARHLKRSRKIRALHSPLVSTLSSLLERGARDGVFRPGVDPVQLYVSIAALGYFYLSNSHTLSTIFGRNLRSRAALAERLAHVTELVVAALTSHGPGVARVRRRS
ncbi:MAG TPA: TetR/AcrR family transcriptional regulator [Casimicrobiaceae bacterium]|nr:TetR/AcrR family transcriptional regulator [Casimicrobiaceae bacterium]